MAGIAEFRTRPLLRLDSVSKRLPAGSLLLDDIDLSVMPSEAVAITGPSGSGKTTLLQIAGGLARPDGGSVELAGLTYSRPADWNAARVSLIGFVFQEGWLFPSLTAAENVELPMLGVEPSAKRRTERVATLLEKLMLSAQARTLGMKLSGGERQRVALARALVNRPRLLLADEPTGNLDTENTRRVVDLLQRFCREDELTLVVATHDLHVAASCDRSLWLADGRLQSDRGR